MTVATTTSNVQASEKQLAGEKKYWSLLFKAYIWQIGDKKYFIFLHDILSNSSQTTTIRFNFLVSQSKQTTMHRNYCL